MPSYLLGTTGEDIKVIKTAFAFKELTWSETDMFTSDCNMKQYDINPKRENNKDKL